jgi:hypothetical protein
MVNKMLLVVLTLLATQVQGQNGYVKLENDSTLIGFLRHYTSSSHGHQGIEVWRTKKDKSPIRIPKRDIYEYAIKKDTFKVFHQFRPYVHSKTVIELIDARLESRGKVNLYTIDRYLVEPKSSFRGGMPATAAPVEITFGESPIIYILEDSRTAFISCLPQKHEMLIEVLKDFFPERYIAKYIEVEGKINYNTISKFVSLYNSK